MKKCGSASFDDSCVVFAPVVRAAKERREGREGKGKGEGGGIVDIPCCTLVVDVEALLKLPIRTAVSERTRT